MENQKDNSIQGHIRGSLETMDKSLLHSARRAGNIAAALYIVSNVLPEGEPLQYEIRKSGLAILSLANDIAGMKGESYDRLTNEINQAIRKAISFLEVGVTLFLISEMNFRVLRLELMALGGSYESRREGLLDIETILKEGREYDGLVSKQERINKPERTERAPKPVNKDKGHIKDIDNKGQTQMMINVLNRPLAPSFGSNNFFKDKSTGSHELNERKIKILESLKNRPESSIADIKTEFPEVSFKTIQRDLQALIDEGRIERVGERRWSMYRLK